MKFIKGRFTMLAIISILSISLAHLVFLSPVYGDNKTQSGQSIDQSAPATAEISPSSTSTASENTQVASEPAKPAATTVLAQASDTSTSSTEAAPAVVSSAKSSDVSDVEGLLNEGKRYYRDGEYDKAVAVWNKVLAADPGNKKALRYIERAEAKISAAAAKPEEIAPAPEQPKTVVPNAIEIPTPVIAAPITPPTMQPETVTEEPATPEKKWDSNSLTLNDAVTIALANHKPARIALEEVLLARMKVTEAKRGLFPTASLKNEEIEGRAVEAGSPALKPFRGREFTLELQQPVFQGGRLVNTLRQAQINLAVSVKNYDKLKEDFVFEVEQAFFSYSNAKTTVKNLEELKGKCKEDLDSILNQQKIGTAREVDVLNIQSQHEDVGFQLTNAKNDLSLAKLTLAQLLGFDVQTDFETATLPELKKADYETLDIDLDECLKLAYQNRSDLYIRELMVQFQNYGVEIAKSKSRMKVDLTGSYGLNREAFQDTKLDLQEEFFVGLKGSLPLGPHTLEENFINQDKAPSAGQTTSNVFESITTTLKFFDNFNTMSVAQAQIAYHKALDEMYKAQKSLDFEVKKAYFDYKKSILNLDGYLAKQKLGEEELKISKSQYDLNQVTLGDLMRNRIKLNEYKNGFGQASTTYYTSVAKLNKTVGISGYFDPITGKREVSLADVGLSRRPYIADKSRVSNYQAELSRAEKMVQSIKPEERWWEIWETDETSHANIKDRWWETWEKDSQTGVVRPKTNWWQPWKNGTPTAPKARKKWWQMWEKEDSISDRPYQKDQDREPFTPKAEDLVTRDMVKQLFQGGGSSK